MALTLSNMLPLGTHAPEFTLPDVTADQELTLSTFANGKPLLVIFLCAHCPYVVHVHQELARIGNDYKERLGIVSICSNDAVSYPADSPENLRRTALAWELPFPVCYDESQEVARAYDAACTPDFFLFDSKHRLVYRGQLDNSRPGKGIADGHDLRKAIDSLLAGQPLTDQQKPSAGCNIKWKAKSH